MDTPRRTYTRRLGELFCTPSDSASSGCNLEWTPKNHNWQLSCL